jgi:hypothetical protein
MAEKLVAAIDACAARALHKTAFSKEFLTSSFPS